MSRKDYKAFAAMLASFPRHTDPAVDRIQRNVLVEVMHRIANIFAEDNPRFDRVRFIDAAQPDPEHAVKA